MGSTIIDQDFPYDILHRGEHDVQRHNKRVDDAVRKQLKDIISQQDIITSEGNKKVKVRLKYLDQYRFIQNRDRVDDVGRDQFDELSEGEVISRPDQGEGDGIPNRPGDQPGEELYEAEYTVEELTDLLIEELQLPNLDPRKKNLIVSDVIEWSDICRQGSRSLINKKRTLRANILRRAKLDKKEPEPIINDDLRYRTYNITQERHSNAVIFLMMDRSGSMWDEKIYAVKSLYFWIVQFLRRKYDHVEIKFIAHDYNARELNEHDFFSYSPSGGTRVSAAYEFCAEMIKHNYPESMWNIYCFHASDGDTWNDEEVCMEWVRKILELGATMFAYSEIKLGPYSNRDESRLLSMFKKRARKSSKILIATVEHISEVMLAIKSFLSSQGSDGDE
jgi:sporulation protein YhbH